MDKSPYIGQMNRKIKIVEFEKTQNSTGEEEIAENVISEPFAFMNEVSGSEDADGKIRHIVNRTYTIRYNTSVLRKATELVVYDNEQKFSVYHVKEIGNTHLVLLVTNYE
ncbi:hypothetical protein B0A75_04705 [Flavobacterium oncorhynchi]|uniref:Head-tail adaptor protein n=1 Tax=Flavobacterium oncorhynchi TaxID=728056 RepID=A0A226I637_9FLAO|nr:hypothetical protein [Flavobacterium oncorhynchi]OXB01745.1 hypothetical protein B0A75_04705 [Flavobacterium oncorhynchi]